MSEKRICGVIVGKVRDDLLSIAEDDDSLLFPFAPSYRNIDYIISSLFNANVKDFIVFVSKKKRLEEYFLKNWNEINISVIELEDLKNNIYFIREKIESLSFSNFIVIKGYNPLWINFGEDLDKIINKDLFFSVKGKTKELCGFSIKEKDFLYKFLNFINNEEIFKDDIITNWHHIHKGNIIELKENIFIKINSIKEYFDLHIDMINNYFYLDDFNSKVPIKFSNFINLESIFEESSYVKNSICGNNVEIKGYVENSIIFSNVKIAKGAKVINSLILPGNHIGSNSIIDTAIIDEFYEDNSFPNIDNHCIIGNKNAIKPNEKYKELDYGITLLGKNIRLPSKMKIGGNCYIKSNVYNVLLKNMKTINDGSFVSN